MGAEEALDALPAAVPRPIVLQQKRQWWNQDPIVESRSKDREKASLEETGGAGFDDQLGGGPATHTPPTSTYTTTFGVKHPKKILVQKWLTENFVFTGGGLDPLQKLEGGPTTPPRRVRQPGHQTLGGGVRLPRLFEIS